LMNCRTVKQHLGRILMAGAQCRSALLQLSMSSLLTFASIG